ncbi:MAG: hypothetical protein KC897_00640 [Candidatus Omnitrophica bacterium]|nr:hypothetical protein [Candidatus Omnitrophota bacterium]MCB9719958.1 hypothetical protein [Candidatus Omnitrophota bacterium]
MMLVFTACLLTAADQPSWAGEIFTYGWDCYDWSQTYILGEADINPAYVTEHTAVARIIQTTPLTLEVLTAGGRHLDPGEGAHRGAPSPASTIGRIERDEFYRPAVTPAVMDQLTEYQFNDIVTVRFYVQSRCDPVGSNPWLVKDIQREDPSSENMKDRLVLLRYADGAGHRLVIYHDGRIGYFFGHSQARVWGENRLSREESLALRRSLKNLGSISPYALSAQPKTPVDGYLIITRDRYFATPLPPSADGADDIVKVLKSVGRRLRLSQEVKISYWDRSKAKMNPWDSTHFTLKELLERQQDDIPVREGHQLTPYLRNNLAKHPADPAFIADGGKVYHIVLGGYGYDTLRIREVTAAKNETRWRRWPSDVGVRLKDIPPDGSIVPSDSIGPDGYKFLESIVYDPRFVEEGFVYSNVRVTWRKTTAP